MIYECVYVVSGGSRGGSLEPPLGQNYFIFMENFHNSGGVCDYVMKVCVCV